MFKPCAELYCVQSRGRGDINTRATRNAIERAGLDGVEIYGANGYSTSSISGRGGARSSSGSTSAPCPRWLAYAFFFGLSSPKIHLFVPISFCELFVPLRQITLGTT